MSLDSIIQATATILGQVENVGNVYSYRRLATDEETFKKLFVTDGQILGWTISRESTDPEEEEQTAHDYHTIVFRGCMGVQDAQNTERTFQNLVETIRAAFQANDTLFDGANYNAEHCDRMKVRKVDYAMFSKYLCHYGELELRVKALVVLGF